MIICFATSGYNSTSLSSPIGIVSASRTKSRLLFVSCTTCLLTLLTYLALAKETQPSPTRAKSVRANGAATFVPRLDEKEQQLLAAMSKRVDVEFENTPLSAAVQELSKLSDIPILVDLEQVEVDGISVDSTIDLKLSHLPLHETFNHLGCNWVIEDGALLLTSFDDAFIDRIHRPLLSDW